jgi:glycosyltransferase involved in cell wall biosynthesis
MKIWIDTEIFRAKPAGGIANLWRGWIDVLRESMPDDDIIVADLCNDADVYLPTYYGVSPYSVPTIVTVYDFIQTMFPSQFGSAPFDMGKMKMSLGKSHSAIAISASTALDLQKHIGYLGDVYVIYPVIPEIDRSPDRNANMNAPYVLLVGNRSGYKNARSLYRDWHSVPQALHIVAVGGEHMIPVEAAFEVSHPGILHRMQNVTDEMLKSLYASATALVYPSLYEGFGIPLVEAMAYGCPVITRDNSSIREVCGQAAVYVGNGTTMQEAMWCVMDHRDDIVTAGIQQLELLRDRCNPAKYLPEAILRAAGVHNENSDN